MLIGLTGAYCAGKNHVGRLLEARGIAVLDVDRLGHQALEAEKKAILDHFGSRILAADGSIDRRLLGALVFGHPEELTALEDIVHPAANRLTEAWIAARPGQRLAINAALLHRSSVFGDLDFIIYVRAPLLTRLLRARRRDHLGFRAIMKRFISQKEISAQYLGKKADIHTVDNRGYSGFLARRQNRALERRIDEILTREGMVDQAWKRKNYCSSSYR